MDTTAEAPPMPVATELEWLRWFALHADFGPADEDVRRAMNRHFREETGKALPPGWDCE